MVVPSISFPVVELEKIVAVQRYEERMQFLLQLLRNPAVRVVYVTSSAVDPAIVDYYLRFVPDPADARRRLEMVDLDDPAVGSLSAKILDRPDVLAALRGLAPHGGTMQPFIVSPAEEALAEALGLRLYGPAAELARLGSKSGSRHAADTAGVRRVEGVEDVFSIDALDDAVDGIQARRPSTSAVVVKLNHGFSGQGNAILRLDGGGDLTSPSTTTFCAAEESWSTFAAKLRADGAVVEELLQADALKSPSVQLRIPPGGPAEILSTHDQILGGPHSQVYLGCRFPADAGYRAEIVADAQRVGAVLAAEGVVGSFGIDFMVVPGDGPAYLSEINLRLGGTTHPYWMARLATGAAYDPAGNELVTGGRALRYVATDNLKSRHLARLSPADVIGRVDDAGLAFDPSTGTGVTLHLLGAVPGHGKLGATCIADSAEAADELYAGLLALLTPSGS